MHNKLLYGLWAGLYVLCAGLGLIPNVSGALKWIFVLCGILFFLPPALLLMNRQKDKKTATTVAVLSALSLGLTLVFLLLNLISVGAGRATGTMLHILLMLVSAPMGCGQYWVIGLFGWACLLFAALSVRKKK